MKHYFHSIPVLFTILLFSVFTQTGCKENVLINSKISPSDSSVSVLDTLLPCITHTFYNDTVITSTNIAGIPIYQAVGSVTDPYFGVMQGATFFNLVPYDFTDAIYDNAIIDSAVLVVPYSGFTYGDSANTALTQTYQAFYLQDTLGFGTTYYSYSDKPLDPVPLSQPTTVALHSLLDSIQIGTVNINPGLKIKLNLDVFKSHLIPAITGIQNSSTGAADFVTAFKGICLKVADTRQSTTAIPYLRLDNTDGTYNTSAQVIVFYHHTNLATQDTLQEHYYFSTSTCAHFNSVNKSYGHYPVSALINSTLANDSLVALQNNPGTNFDVIVPGIKNLPQGIIIKADLQLSILPGSNNPANFAIPSRLYPLGVGNGNYPTGIDNGLTYIVADRYPIGSISPYAILDGNSHSITSGSTTITTFNIGIPREVMASIAAKNDTIHLHVTGTQDYYGAFHMVAGGGNYPDPQYRAKLKVVYSTLKK